MKLQCLSRLGRDDRVPRYRRKRLADPSDRRGRVGARQAYSLLNGGAPVPCDVRQSDERSAWNEYERLSNWGPPQLSTRAVYA
ncbi:hypothetical protein LUTEI9C_100225 [Luteimonas sp. 9C]|nr:hypothetical protein LUTEI9C_100225 [Luteimonas sp. 9C]